jgi:hypothetical protein
VEFIVPRTENEDGKVFLVGHLLAREGDKIKCEANEIYVDGKKLLRQVMSEVRIGAERRYGFGRLKLDADRIARCTDLFDYPLKLDGEKPIIEIKKGAPLPAHFLVENLDAEGEIEPLLGREWDEVKGPGRLISAAKICWMPGAKTRQTGLAEIRPMGIGAMT